MQKLINIIFIALLSFQFTACTDDEPIEKSPIVDLKLNASVNMPDTDLMVKLYTVTEQEFTTGYNTFFIGVFDTNDNLVSDITLASMPIMTMTDKSHSAPHEVLGISDEIGGGMQEFATVFVMPTSEMGSWALNVSYTDGGQSYQIEIPVVVSNPEVSRMTSIAMPDGQALFVSLVLPSEPTVGSNDFEVTVHKKVSMMEWPAMKDYTITIEPEMPAMGHGSPNNVDPVHTNNGHYKGIVNFTMTGEWQINISITEGTEVIAETALSIIL